MLNRIIYSNEGKLKNSIEQTAVKVLETYTYGEFFIPQSDNTVKSIIDTVKNQLKDEIFPLKIYNINNYGIMFSLSGENSIKAYGEIILLCINIALAVDLKDFALRVGADGELLDSLKDLASDYEIEGHISFINTKDFEVTGICGAKEVLKGGISENCIYAEFDMDALLEVLYTDKIKNAISVPTVVVGSDDLKSLHQTAFGLRAKGLTVETYIKKGTMYDAEEYAELKNIPILMWITEEGRIIMKNVKNGEMSETTLENILKAAE